MYYIVYGDQLAHHGIKGQKWGVRKYQNQDGSYTSAGRIRYGVGKARSSLSNAYQNTSSKDLKNVQKLNKGLQSAVKSGQEISRTVDRISESKQKTPTPVRKPKVDLNTISDKELQQVINRLNMEQQYARLTAEPKKVSKGKQAVDNALSVGGAALSVVGSALSIAIAIKTLKEK